MSKLVKWLVIIAIVVWVISNPVHAGDSLRAWTSGALTFFHHLAGS